MRKLNNVITAATGWCLLLLLAPTFSHAKDWYVATNGADSNPGSILQPFKNWDKLTSVMHAGDVAYIRGGTYTTQYTGNKELYCYWNNLGGTSLSFVTIQNYPGEVPVFDLTSVGNPLNPDPFGIYIASSAYIHIKGLRVTGLKQNTSGTGISCGFGIVSSPNAIVEQIVVDHIGGTGMHVYNGTDDLLILNSDFHDNADNLSTNSPAYGGGDGVGITGGVTATRTVFTGCRFWRNSDDGIDNFNTNGIRTYNQCWAFWNGYRPDSWVPGGNGSGFKLGPTSTNQESVKLRFLNQCLAFGNLEYGFDQNGTPTTQYQVYNCNAYDNGNVGFQFQYYSGSPIAQTLKNNISYVNSSPVSYAGPNTDVTNNTWNGVVNVTNADFVSLDTTGVTGPRGPNGELPVLNFMKLVSGSDLRAAGTNVGYGTDIGAYQYSGTTPVTANAGSGVVLTLPTNSTTLNGSGTGTSISYQWTALVAPGAFTFSSSTSAVTDVSNLVQGTYTFRLRVASSTDTAYSTVQVIVNPSGGSIVPTGVIIRSVTVNRFGTTTLQYDATVTTNSRSFNIQRRSPRGTVYSSIGTQSATAGKLAYKLTFQSPAGYMIRVCPVDKQGSPVCSAGVVVKKN